LRRASSILWAIAIGAIVLVVFLPTVRNGFTGYDDPEYVTANPHVNTGLSWENARWALTAAHSSNWHPLTWLSHALDCTLFELAPAGHHGTSLVLHAINAALVFLWLAGATGRLGLSACVALVFGLHPLHVESVAWVSERKDVLSTLFWLLALIAYTAYARKGGMARYCLVAALLAAGLLAKQMPVTMPMLLLVLDWWPLERGVRLVEKLPLLAISAMAAAAAIWAQRMGGAVSTLEQLPLGLRLENAAVSYVRYLGKMAWPVDLAVFYPMPPHGIPVWQAAASVAAIAAISAGAFAVRRRHPWLLAGWCWYVITLAPVIGIVQVGMQAMADRYTYVPMIGIAMAVVWEVGDRWPRPAAVVGVAALAAMAVLSWRQIAVWQDGVSLFTHAIAVTTDNFVAHDNLGVELDRRGRADEALEQYRETLRIKPGDRNGEANYAQASFAKGERLYSARHAAEALAMFREGLRYRPRNAMAHSYVGLILTEQNQLGAAAAEFRRAIEIDPRLTRAHLGLGAAMARAGDAAGARRSFQDAVRSDPGNFEARFDLAVVDEATGRLREAQESYDAALGIKPDSIEAKEGRARVAGK